MFHQFDLASCSLDFNPHVIFYVCSSSHYNQGCEKDYSRHDFISTSPFFPFILLEAMQKENGKPHAKAILLNTLITTAHTACHNSVSLNRFCIIFNPPIKSIKFWQLRRTTCQIITFWLANSKLCKNEKRKQKCDMQHVTCCIITGLLYFWWSKKGNFYSNVIL